MKQTLAQPFFDFVQSVKEPPKPVYDVSVSPAAIKHVNSKGLLHKEDGPALIHPDGSTEWWQNGQRHRLNGPAREAANGTKEWYMNHQNHRTDGPAVVKSCGDQLWYLNGKLHREDGPAVIFADKSTKWYYNGQLHREDGPAIERADFKQWYWMGRNSTEQEVKWRLRDKELRKNPPVMGKDLCHCYELRGKPHNLDGPARVWNDGTKEWFITGERHNASGPAVVLPNGEEYYYLYDEFLSKISHSVRLSLDKQAVEHTSKPAVEASIEVEVKEEEPKTPSKSDAEKNKVKQWPDDPNETVPYQDIFAPFKDVLEHGYRLIRKDSEWKFDYNGYEIGKQEKKVVPNVKEHLSEKFLKREKDKHNNSLMDVVMRLLFMMGIEQGRRMAYREQIPIKSLEKTLASYRERNKSIRYQLSKATAIVKVMEENPTATKEERQNLIQIELEKTRRQRLEEIQKEIRMDPSLSCFKSKVKKKAKLTNLLSLANTLDTEIFQHADWIGLLDEAGCSQQEWKAFCRKHKFNKFIGAT